MMNVHPITGFGAMTVVLSLMLSGCSFRLRTDGLKSIRLGDPFLTAEQVVWNQGTARDTVLTESGYEWRALILPDRHGSILVEEDFFEAQRVNRIRVESRSYRVAGNIRVGTDVAKLSRWDGDWMITALPDYGVLDLYNTESPAFHFLIACPNDGPTPQLLEEIDSTQRILGIVIM